MLYTEICLISNDVVKEMNVLLCSRHDKLKDFCRLSLVDNYQH